MLLKTRFVPVQGCPCPWGWFLWAVTACSEVSLISSPPRGAPDGAKWAHNGSLEASPEALPSSAGASLCPYFRSQEIMLEYKPPAQHFAYEMAALGNKIRMIICLKQRQKVLTTATELGFYPYWKKKTYRNTETTNRKHLISNGQIS